MMGADEDNEAAMREKLKSMYEEHLERITVQQQTVDFRINADTLDILNVFFLVTGLLAFVALGLCTLGIVRYNSGRPFRSMSETGTFDRELLDYNTFEEFSTECCCIPHSNVSLNRTESPNLFAGWQEDYRDIEKWVCGNGKVKERMRSWTRVWHNASNPPTNRTVVTFSGLELRPLCGMAFARPSCAPTYDNATLTVTQPTAAGCPGLFRDEFELSLW